MSYREMPTGLALIACDTIIEDRRTGKKSLIGLFAQLNVARLPCVHSSLSLLVSLSGGSGEYSCEVLCVNENRQSPVFSVKGKIKFENPQQVLDMVFQLRAVKFPVAGMYWLKVLIDDIPLMMRPLIISQRDGLEEQPPEKNQPEE